MNLFSLVASLALDKSAYESGIKEAQTSAQGFASKLKSGLGAAAKVGVAAVAAIGTAATAMGAALVKNAGEVAAYGDNIDKASQKMGISAKAYQEWDAVLQHSGTSIDAMGIGMKTLANKAAEGSDAFKALGISQKKAASMSREELFSQTITALQNVKDENKRAQLAQELFGRSALELGPLLNTSAAETQAMKDRVNELGGVMSNEAVKAAAAYQDSLQDMTTAMDGAKRNLISQFLPGITTVMDGLTTLFSGGDGVGKITEGVGKIVDKIGELAPVVMEKGARIVLGLGDAIVQNLPKLISAAAKTVYTLAGGLLNQLPTIVKAGLQILVTLAQSIVQGLPRMIPSIVSIIMQIVDTLTDPDTLAQLIEAGLQIVIALAEGLIAALPQLAERAPVIVENLAELLIRSAPRLLIAAWQLMVTLARGIYNNIDQVFLAAGQIVKTITDTIGGLVASAWNWGKDMVLNLWEGIKAFVSWPINAIKDLASTIWSYLHFSEPEIGPLADFSKWAPDMMRLYSQGITDNKGMVSEAIGDAFNVRKAVNGAMTGDGSTIVTRRDGGYSGKQSAVMMLDHTVFGRLIYELYNEYAAAVGVKLTRGGDTAWA